jgi:hypothetical protein
MNLLHSIMQDLADLRAMALNADFTVADMAQLGGWE